MSFRSDDAALRLRVPIPLRISSLLPSASSARLPLLPGVRVHLLRVLLVALRPRMARLEHILADGPPAPQALAANVHVRLADNVRPERLVLPAHPPAHLPAPVEPARERIRRPPASVLLSESREPRRGQFEVAGGDRDVVLAPLRQALRPADLVLVRDFRFRAEVWVRARLAWLARRLLGGAGAGGGFGCFAGGRGGVGRNCLALAEARRRRRLRCAHQLMATVAVHDVVLKREHPSVGVSDRHITITTVGEG